MSYKLITNLDFAQKINDAKSVTESGKEMLKKYRGFCYMNPATPNIVNAFVREAQSYKYDKGINECLCDILSYINENKYSWQLMSTCELLSESKNTYSYLSKSAIKQVQELLEMNEQDVVKYIKAGALKNVQYITEFRNICKTIYKNTINESVVNEYNVVKVPYGYISNIKTQTFFMASGKTYVNENGVVTEAKFNDSHFVYMNNLVNKATISENNINIKQELHSGKEYQFNINESNITLVNGTNKSVFNRASEIREHVDTISTMMIGADKTLLMNACECAINLFEEYDNVVKLDNVKVIEANGKNGIIETFTIVESKDNVIVNAINCAKTGNCTRSFNYIVEAINFVKNATNIDLTNLYENRISNEINSSAVYENKVLTEKLIEERNEELNIRRRKIEILAEQFKNNPVKLAVLNKIAKELSMLENK